MSKSAILSSSIAKKWWMALTGLFLCTFLIGHLLGNLQLIMISGEEGRLAFNEYAYFMTHNPFIKVLSWVTYISILFHAIDGFLLTYQNKKARPINYAYNKPSANTKLPSRYMAIMGTVILVFICTHMANFWWKMKFSSDPFPLHKTMIYAPLTQAEEGEEAYVTMNGGFLPVNNVTVKNGNELFVEYNDDLLQQYPQLKNDSRNPSFSEGYKDLHSLVFAFFGHDKSKEAGIPANEYALIAVIAYVLSMLVLGFHLFHGFGSAFQSLGANHRRYNPIIKNVGMAFSILVPIGFAIIPVLIYMWK